MFLRRLDMGTFLSATGRCIEFLENDRRVQTVQDRFIHGCESIRVLMYLHVVPAAVL